VAVGDGGAQILDEIGTAQGIGSGWDGTRRYGQQNFYNQVLSTRGPRGWSTRNIAIPRGSPTRPSHIAEYSFFSKDLSLGLVEPLDVPQAVNGNEDVYEFEPEGMGSCTANRTVADCAGIADQGQISKLLARLHRLGLIENAGAGATRGEPNAWTLTAKGREVEGAISSPTERS
jgi:hypothetical protein